MNLKDITVSRRSQSQYVTYGMILYVWLSGKDKISDGDTSVVAKGYGFGDGVTVK